MDEWRAVAVGEAEGHIYSRNTNRTVEVFEEKLRVLDGAEAATSFATGMAAISDTLDNAAIERAIDDGLSLLYLESPTNPTCTVLDLERLARRATAAGAIVVVDNTFATPINQRPLELGADLVVHSATKYLGGHADALGGVLAGRAELVERVFRYREVDGAALHPEAAYLLLRGMKTGTTSSTTSTRPSRTVTASSRAWPTDSDETRPRPRPVYGPSRRLSASRLRRPPQGRAPALSACSAR